MSRAVVRGALALAAALWLGCNETSISTASRVGIQGATDLVLVNDLVFVTATDTNELRALNLTPPEGKIVDWVRAPNPLHPLSIPVVERPIELEGDVVWGADGRQGSGSYVYARAASGREVSVVDANRDVLRQVARVHTFGAGGSDDILEEITAIAARGGADGSTLYVATYDGERSQIWAVAIPKSGSPADAYPSALTTTNATPVGGEEPCGAILSILVLPGDQIAYSVRRTPALGTTCGPTTEPEIATLRAETSVMLNTTTGARTVLEFGTPMRRLFTNPRYADRPEANRIYGIVDEGSCGLTDRCRGILAVVGPTFADDPIHGTPADPAGQPCGGVVGAIACDAAGLPMAPIQSENALVMSAIVVPLEVAEKLPEFARPAQPSRLTGVSSQSDGTLQLWDAENLTDFDLNEAPAVAESIYQAGPDGTPVQLVRGLVDRDSQGQIAVTLADGAARNEIIRVRHGGTLPDFTGRPAPVGATIAIAGVPPDEVRVGDVVTGTGTCAATQTTVTAVSAGAITLADVLATGPGCSFSISPPVTDGASDWIVFGTRSGFLGRFTAPAAGAGPVTLSFPEDPAQRRALFFTHPRNDSDADPDPLITFQFQGTEEPLPLGTTYVITSRSNFQRATVAMSQQRLESFFGASTIPRARVGGAIVLRPGTTQTVVSYPSDNALMLFDAVELSPPNDLSALTPYF